MFREEDLPCVSDYLDRYCDNDCTKWWECAEFCESSVKLCCQDCLVFFAKEALAALEARDE